MILRLSFLLFLAGCATAAPPDPNAVSLPRVMGDTLVDMLLTDAAIAAGMALRR